MGRKPKNTKPVSQETQFELPNMPEKDIKKMTDLEIAAEKRKRNEYGLLPGYDYKFTEEGFVDWQAMIPQEFFYAKDENGNNIEDISDLPPEKKIINLDGIKWLMQARGAESVTYPTVSAYPDYGAVSCEISWIPNFEQNFRPLVTSGEGEAHAFNNKAPFKYLVATLAENKALSRAVRSACRIKSYSTDEMRGENIEKDDDGNKSYGASQQSCLEKICDENNISFEKMRKRYCDTTPINADVAMTWQSFKDVPALVCMEIIGKIEKKKS